MKMFNFMIISLFYSHMCICVCLYRLLKLSSLASHYHPFVLSLRSEYHVKTSLFILCASHNIKIAYATATHIYK